MFIYFFIYKSIEIHIYPLIYILKFSNFRSETEFSALKEMKYWMDSHVDSAGMKCATGTISPLGIIGIKNENESGFFFENEKKDKKSGSNFLEETFAMIKPIAASYYGDEIISVILGHGFEIVQQLSTTLTIQKAEQFYAEHSLKGYFKYLTEYMSSGPIVALHLRRVAAVAGWKHLIGYVHNSIYSKHVLYNISTHVMN